MVSLVKIPRYLDPLRCDEDDNETGNYSTVVRPEVYGNKMGLRVSEWTRSQKERLQIVTLSSMKFYVYRRPLVFFECVDCIAIGGDDDVNYDGSWEIGDHDAAITNDKSNNDNDNNIKDSNENDNNV